MSGCGSRGNTRLSKDEIFKLFSRARRFGGGSDTEEEEEEEGEVEQEVETSVEREGKEAMEEIEEREEMEAMEERLRVGLAETEAVGDSLRF